LQGLSYGLSAGILLHVSLITLMTTDNSGGHSHSYTHSTAGDELSATSERHDASSSLLQVVTSGDVAAVRSLAVSNLEDGPRQPPAWARVICLLIGAGLMAVLGVLT
jgi:hypothetical protein